MDITTCRKATSQVTNAQNILYQSDKISPETGHNPQNLHKSTNEEFVSKTSYIHPDMLLICIIDFLLQLK